MADANFTKKNKRLIILFICDLLEKGTSPDNPFSITKITNALNKLGIKCERRTVSRNINYLIAYGKPIIKLPSGKVYYDKSLEKNK
ncbi:MAG: hypothetical protein SPL13_01810 [Clostridia bacterium]|nr:hypothetical protein [Clostridia bacterium]